jgi:hypothetical protein
MGYTLLIGSLAMMISLLLLTIYYPTNEEFENSYNIMMVGLTLLSCVFFVSYSSYMI